LDRGAGRRRDDVDVPDSTSAGATFFPGPTRRRGRRRRPCGRVRRITRRLPCRRNGTTADAPWAGVFGSPFHDPPGITSDALLNPRSHAFLAGSLGTPRHTTRRCLVAVLSLSLCGGPFCGLVRATSAGVFGACAVMRCGDPVPTPLLSSSGRVDRRRLGRGPDAPAVPAGERGAGRSAPPIFPGAKGCWSHAPGGRPEPRPAPCRDASFSPHGRRRDGPPRGDAETFNYQRIHVC
jgi:hypothetical protein